MTQTYALLTGKDALSYGCSAPGDWVVLVGSAQGTIALIMVGIVFIPIR